MYKYPVLIVLLTATIVASCSFRGSNREGSSGRETPERPLPVATGSQSANIDTPATARPVDTLDKDSMTAADCRAVDAGDNVVMNSQTFPIDFSPFEGSCFVTVHNPEYDDPPMESEFAIYTAGKKVFDFPDQFNGVTFGCWVNAVSFQDLNADRQTDIIVVGKCSAKMGPYNENSVYVNNGRSFTTNVDANHKLADLAKVKDIADFVQKNQQFFFR